MTDSVGREESWFVYSTLHGQNETPAAQAARSLFDRDIAPFEKNSCPSSCGRQQLQPVTFRLLQSAPSQGTWLQNYRPV